MYDEFELLARARALDEEALGQIHDMYYPLLFRFIAFRVNDQHIAEDLASEVFLRLLNALRDHSAPRKTLRGWLYTVASRLVAEHYRKEKRYQQVQLDDTLAAADNPARMVDSQLSHEHLRRAMQTLTEEQQNVIALRFGWELSVREVAEALGKSEGAIKQLQARAVAALSRVMQSGGAG